MTALEERPQLVLLGDDVLEDEKLEALLEDWAKAKAKLQPYKEEFDSANKEAKGHIEGLELAEGTYHCGRYIVRIAKSDGTHVEFERRSRTAISIRAAKEDE